MVLPDPKLKPAARTPPKNVAKPADKSTSSKVTTGPEVKSGSARVDTGGAAIPFGGLSTGGGAQGGGAAFTDYANFCCPGYLTEMTDLIKRNWNQNQGAAGLVQVKFTIRRDGTLGDVAVEKPSGAALLDLESMRAVQKTQRLPPLPREFTPPTLTVHLIFEYTR
jgi:protein TonB